MEMGIMGSHMARIRPKDFPILYFGQKNMLPDIPPIFKLGPLKLCPVKL